MSSGSSDSNSVIKMNKASKAKRHNCEEVKIKIEPGTEAGDSSKPTGPQPGTREFEIQRLKAQRADEKVESPVKVSRELGKRKSMDELCAKLIVINIMDLDDSSDAVTDVPIAMLAIGDLYGIRHLFKSAYDEETAVNGVALPMIADCLKPKWISPSLMASLLRSIPVESKTFCKFLASNCEQAWLLYAPPVEEVDANTTSAAASVSAAVSIREYAEQLKRALTGKPVHYDKVDIINYFVGADEVKVVDTMYHTPDPHFGRRASTYRKV